MLGIDGVADAALDFDAEDERVQEGFARDGLALCQRKDGGRDGTAWVDHRLQMRVVEVERVRRDAVHERGLHDVEAVAAAEHGRLCRTRKLCEGSKRALDCLVTARADCAAHPVQKRARGFVPHRLGHVGRLVLDDETGERAGYFHSGSP